MQMPGDKQRVLTAANVWSYPMAVDLSFREKRAPQVLQHEKTTSMKQLHESLKLLPSIVSCSKIHRTSLHPEDRHPEQSENTHLRAEHWDNAT